MTDNNALAQQLEALAKLATPDTLMNYGEPEVGMRTEPFFGEPLKGNMRPLADWTAHDAELVIKLWNNLPAILSALRQPTPASGEVGDLVAELQEEATRLSGSSIERGCVDCGLAANIALKAADMLERLAAPVQEPDADNTPHAFVWAAPDTCRNCGNTEDHPVHQPTQQPGADQVERVRNAIRDHMNKHGPICTDALARAALTALTPSAVGEQWQPIETAPYNTAVKIKVGQGMEFIARLIPDASMTTDEQSCDQWQAEHEGEHPDCWHGGCCWESNADLVTSMQPEGWMPLSALLASLPEEG